MKTNDIILMGVVVGGAAILLSKGKVGSYVGRSVGETIGGAAGGVASGAVIGSVKSILIDPYEWARTYPGYIPIIDDLAKAAIKVKRWGDPNAWWY